MVGQYDVIFIGTIKSFHFLYFGGLLAVAGALGNKRNKYILRLQFKKKELNTFYNGLELNKLI